MMKANYTIQNDSNHDFTSSDVYVYELHNPITNLPFYVGKGTGNRATQHISHRRHENFAKNNPHKIHTINQIIESGQKVIIRIAATCKTEQEAFDHERILIEKYGRRIDGSGILTNITNGGEGQTRDSKTVDQFSMWGEFIKTWKSAKEATLHNNWKCLTAIHKCCTGHERSYKGFLWAYTGNKPTLPVKNKPIYQWTLDHQLVQIHKNEHAAADFIGCNYTNIWNCVNKKTKTAKGFIWTNTNEPSPN